MSVPIPVIPFNSEAELEKEMESKKGKLGLGDMLNSQDASTGNTMYHDLLQGAESSPPNPAALNFLQTVGNKLKEIWNQGPFPGSEDDPRDSQGSKIINGMHEDLYNADPGYQKRFNDSLGL